ncbi:MAG: imidazolonepropionase [Saprospiraceae bacterium]
MPSLLIRNIKLLVQVRDQAPAVVRGKDMAQLPVLADAYLLMVDGKIERFGPMSDCPDKADKTLDATGRMVFPGWCDSHTHLVFAASREEEFVNRIKGMSYEEIAAHGGGILNSAKKLRATSEDDLFASARKRLDEIIAMGTGAVEIKSGYGLSIDSELKSLRVIKRLKEVSPIPIKASFLGAHAMPLEFKENREVYIQQIIEEMLPVIAREGLADYIDVFCEKGFYSQEETDRILKAGAQYGLKAKIHANQLHYSGGVQVGVANGAVSVDHLEHCGPEEIACLQTGNTLPTLLPSCSFFLGIPYAPARALIEADLPVVLATDYNPGSTPSGNVPFLISLACINMKMLPEEAINATTINGAAALELEKEVGSITVGKRANVWISAPMPSYAYLPYAFGSSLVDTVILNGVVYPNQLQD